MVPKSESLCKKKMNCLGYVLTFRSLLRVLDEGKEEDVERGLCKEPTTDKLTFKERLSSATFLLDTDSVSKMPTESQTTTSLVI